MNITQTFYDSMAPHYDKLFGDWQAATREQAIILNKLFRDQGFDNTARILDCACGIGTQAIGLASLGYSVTASDISSAELAEAKKRAENNNVRAELIGDAFHVMPPVVRLIFSVFGPERMIIVSDALRCCGMPKGQYELGGQIVVLEDVVGRLLDGTVAGSITNLYTCMQRMMECGIDEEDVIRAATHNPACAIGADDKIGTIEPGKYADFIICTDNYATKRVFRGGKEI